MNNYICITLAGNMMNFLKHKEKIRKTTASALLAFAAAAPAHIQAQTRPVADDISSYVPLAETTYTRELEDLKNKTEKRMQETGRAKNNRVIILSPDTYNAVAPTQIIPQTVLTHMLAKQRAPLNDLSLLMNGAFAIQENTAAASLKDAANRPMAFYFTPEVLLEKTGEADTAMCVIVPSSSFGSRLPIKGSTPLESRRFANEHEACHCLGPEMTENKEQEDTPIRSLQHDMKREIFADVCAAGEMVTQGAGTEFISRLAKTREVKTAGDIKNASSSALLRFRQEILRRGVKRFRNMPAPQQLALANDIASKETPSLPEIERLQQRFAGKEAVTESASLPDVSGWDANNVLLEAAQKAEGAITRRGLIRARSQILSHLQGEMARHPEDLHYPAMMLQLNRAFDNMIKKTPAMPAPAAP